MLIQQGLLYKNRIYLTVKSVSLSCLKVDIIRFRLNVEVTNLVFEIFKDLTVYFPNFIGFKKNESETL